MPIASAPPTTTRRFYGPNDTATEMVRLCLGDRGERSVLVRDLKDHIVRGLAPKDYLGELLAIRNFAAEKIRYSNDPAGVESIQDPQRMAETIIERGMGVGDCDDIATFIGCLARQLGRDTEFCIVGFGAEGEYSHVFARAKEPRSGKWIILDPVAGTNEGKMARRITTFRTYRVG